MRIKRLAIGFTVLGGLASPLVCVRPAQAQGTAARAAIAGCVAQPEACAVIGAVGGAWVLWRHAPRLWCTAGWCTPTSGTPREFRNGGDDAKPQPGETYKLSTSRSGCKDQHKRMQAADYQVNLRIVRNPNWRNGATEFLCFYSGRDAWKIPRFWR